MSTLYNLTWILALGLVLLFATMVTDGQRALADAMSTGFKPNSVTLDLGTSEVITLETANVDSTVIGVQVNIQHPDTLTVTDPSCIGIFVGGIVLPAVPVAGGTLVGCVLFSGPVSGTSGDVMTITLTRVGESTDNENELVTMLVDEDNPFTTSFVAFGDNVLHWVGPGMTNELTASSASP